MIEEMRVTVAGAVHEWEEAWYVPPEVKVIAYQTAIRTLIKYRATPVGDLMPVTDELDPEFLEKLPPISKDTKYYQFTLKAEVELPDKKEENV